MAEINIDTVTHERMQEAIDLVVSKQDNDRRWSLERTLNERFQTNIEPKGKPSK